MKTTKTNLSSPNAAGANERAQIANSFAKRARDFRDRRNDLKELLREWERIMVDSPVVLLTIAFLFLAIVEIIISWKMYGELQSGILSSPSPFVSIFIGLMTVSLGAVVSHYVSKRLSSSLFELEVFNMCHQSNHAIALAVAEEKVRIKARRHFKIGLILFTILVIGVMAISSQRVGLMGALSGQSFGLVQKWLPVIVVTLEVFCGIYLGYFFNRMKTRRKIKRQHDAFEENKKVCAYETRMTKECYDHAIKCNEPISYNRELRDTTFRFEHRGQDNDHYVDEIPVAKNIRVLIMDDGKAIAGVHLYGLLPGHEYTNAIWTNDTGQAVLEWQSDAEYLESLVIDNREHQGPFRNNSNVKIDIDKLKMLQAVG